MDASQLAHSRRIVQEGALPARQITAADVSIQRVEREELMREPMLVMAGRTTPGYRPGRSSKRLHVLTYRDLWSVPHNCHPEYFSGAPWGAKPSALSPEQRIGLTGRGQYPRPTKGTLDAYEQEFGPWRMRLGLLDLDRAPHKPWTVETWNRAVAILREIPVLAGLVRAKTRRGLRIGYAFHEPLTRAQGAGAKRLAFTLVVNLEVARVCGVTLDPVLAAHGSRHQTAARYLASSGLPFFAEPRSADPVPEHTAAVGALARRADFVPHVHVPEVLHTIDLPGLELPVSGEQSAAYELATRPSIDEVHWDAPVPANLPRDHQRVADAVDQGLRRVRPGHRHEVRLAIARALLGTAITAHEAYDVYRAGVGATNESGDALVWPYRSTVKAMADGRPCIGPTWLRQHKLADVAAAIATLGSRGRKDPLAEAKQAAAKFGPDGRRLKPLPRHPDDRPDIHFKHQFVEGVLQNSAAHLVRRRTLIDVRRHLRGGQGVLVLAAPTGTYKTSNTRVIQEGGGKRLIYVGCSNRQAAEYQAELNVRSMRMHSMLGECPEIARLAGAYGLHRRQAPEIRRHLDSCHRCDTHKGVTSGASITEQRRMRRVAGKLRPGRDPVMLDNVFPRVSWGTVLRDAGFTAPERHKVLHGRDVEPGRQREFRSIDLFRQAALAVAPGREKELDEELRWARNAAARGCNHSYGRIGDRLEWGMITERGAETLSRVDLPEGEQAIITNQGSFQDTEPEWAESGGLIIDDVTGVIVGHKLNAKSDAEDARTARVILSDTPADALGGDSPQAVASQFIATFRRALPATGEARTMLPEELSCEALRQVLPAATRLMEYAQSAAKAKKDDVAMYSRQESTGDTVYAHRWARFWTVFSVRVALATWALGDDEPESLVSARILIQPSEHGTELWIDGPSDFALTVADYIQKTRAPVVLLSATPGLAPHLLRQLGVPVCVQRYYAETAPGVRIRHIKVVAPLGKRRIDRWGWSVADIAALHAGFDEPEGDTRVAMLQVWLSQEALFGALLRRAGAIVVEDHAQPERDLAAIATEAKRVGDHAVHLADRTEIARQAWEERLALWDRVMEPFRGVRVYLRHHRGSTGRNEGQEMDANIIVGDSLPPPDIARRQAEYARGLVHDPEATGWPESREDAEDALQQGLGRGRPYTRPNPLRQVHIGAGKIIPEGPMALAELREPRLPAGFGEQRNRSAPLSAAEIADVAGGLKARAANKRKRPHTYLAEALGVEPRTAKRWCLGETTPSAEAADQIRRLKWEKFPTAGKNDLQVSRNTEETAKLDRSAAPLIINEKEGNSRSVQLSEFANDSEYLETNLTGTPLGKPVRKPSTRPPVLAGEARAPNDSGHLDIERKYSRLPATPEKLRAQVPPSVLARAVGCSPEHLARDDLDPFTALRLEAAARSVALAMPATAEYDAARRRFLFRDGRGQVLACGENTAEILRALGRDRPAESPVVWPSDHAVVTLLGRVLGVVGPSQAGSRRRGGAGG